MRLHLAGADSVRNMVAALSGSLAADATKTPNLLTSYWYSKLKQGQKGNKEWCHLYDTLEANWIIDSGLFTMMLCVGSNKIYTMADLMDYAEKYIRYLKQIRFRHAAVEMDVHKVLGLKALAELRKYFEDNWPVEQTIYTWHIEEGIDGLHELAKRYPYIAISIPEIRKIAKERKRPLLMMVTNLLMHIKEAGGDDPPKVHMLGCTQPDLMFNNMYYSCDSKSWTAPQRWKRVQIFSGETFKAFDKDWGVFKKSVKTHEHFIKSYCEIAKHQHGVEHTFNDHDVAAATLACWYKRMELTINKKYFGGTHK